MTKPLSPEERAQQLWDDMDLFTHKDGWPSDYIKHIVQAIRDAEKAAYEDAAKFCDVGALSGMATEDTKVERLFKSCAKLIRNRALARESEGE